MEESLQVIVFVGAQANDLSAAVGQLLTQIRLARFLVSWHQLPMRLGWLDTRMSGRGARRRMYALANLSGR